MKKIKKVNKINLCSLDQYDTEKCPCTCRVICNCKARPTEEYSTRNTFSLLVHQDGKATPTGAAVVVMPGEPEIPIY